MAATVSATSLAAIGDVRPVPKGKASAPWSRIDWAANTVNSGFSKKTVGRICTAGIGDQSITCSASQCMRCWPDSSVLVGVIWDTVIWDILTSTSRSAVSAASAQTTVVASRYEAETLMLKNTRSTPCSAAATPTGFFRSPPTPWAPPWRNASARPSSRCTIARTGWLAANSRSTTCRLTPPTPPPAPVTRYIGLVVMRMLLLFPGENRWLEFVDRIVTPLQTKPAQLQEYSTGRRVDEVVSQRYLHDRPWAFRDGDEPRRIRALQLVQPYPVDRHNLVRRRSGIEPSAAPEHHRGDDVSGPGRVVVEQTQHRWGGKFDADLLVQLSKRRIDRILPRVQSTTRKRPLRRMRVE